MKRLLAILLSAVLVMPAGLFAQQQTSAAGKQKTAVATQAEPGAASASGAALAALGPLAIAGIVVAVVAIGIAVTDDDDTFIPPAATATK